MDKIYLAGSFYGFRDQIINALPDFTFADPRKHRQHSIASLDEDDMKEAEESPILLACFPEGKDRGTMTYAEIGDSRVNGNYIMIADETPNKDPLLRKFADENLKSINESIKFIKLNNKKLKSEFEKINKTKTDLSKVVKNVLFAGDPYTLARLETDTEKNFINYNDITNLCDFKKIDMAVVHFPEMGNWDRKAIFYMGVSYGMQTPIILFDEKEIPYPPLCGLARRIFRNKESLIDYVNAVESQKIEDEAKLMYNLFKKYDNI
jgi:hypothetical protein